MNKTITKFPTAGEEVLTPTASMEGGPKGNSGRSAPAVAPPPSLDEQLRKLAEEPACRFVLYSNHPDTNREYVLALFRRAIALAIKDSGAVEALDEIATEHRFCADEKPNSYCSIACADKARTALAALRKLTEDKP